MDKILWDSHAKLFNIINDLTIILPKAVLYFKCLLHVPPPPANAMLKVRNVTGFSTMHVRWGEGQIMCSLNLVQIFVLCVFKEPQVPKILVHD